MVSRFLGANDPGWEEKVLTSQGKTSATLTTEGSKGGSPPHEEQDHADPSSLR